MQPLSEWYFDSAGYRRLGLRYDKHQRYSGRALDELVLAQYWHCADDLWVCRADDLIPEETEIVQIALKRLSPKEAYDRVFRMRRAFQVCTRYLAT